MKYFLGLFLLFFSHSGMATSSSDSDFLLKQNKDQKEDYTFTPMENAISGFAAFSIGNIGYFSSKSSTLKMVYTGIQTIGIINIGKGIYQSQSPSLKKGFYQLVNNKQSPTISKEELAKELIRINAQEERAKRLALFYSSTFLTAQYTLNATLGSPPGRLKNAYFFLAGVNALIALYSGPFKRDYEKHYYGDSFDINPFAYQDKGITSGLALSYNF